MRWSCLIFAFLGSLLACGDGTGPDPDRICSAPLQVTATRSVTPTVSWAGGCRVNQVVIHQLGPASTLAWAVFFARGADSLVPPIQYGVLPTGTQQLPDNPEPLQPGTTYIVNVAVTDSSIGGAVVVVGSDTIVP